MEVIVLIGLGLILGSFINALVWRMRQRELAEEKGVKAKLPSVAKGRSICTHCKHILAPKDLIPVISWISLRGKCRYCHKYIQDNPLPEVLLPILFVISYFWWPVALSGHISWLIFGVWLAWLVVMTAVVVYDFKWMIIPLSLAITALLLALLFAALQAYKFGDVSTFIMSLVVGVVYSTFFYALYQLSGGKWIGGGDIYLALPLGIMLGSFDLLFLSLFIASLTGCLGSLPLLFKSKKGIKTVLPFGPYLVLGAIISKLFGTVILNWYMDLFL